MLTESEILKAFNAEDEWTVLGDRIMRVGGIVWKSFHSFDGMYDIHCVNNYFTFNCIAEVEILQNK